MNRNEVTIKFDFNGMMSDYIGSGGIDLSNINAEQQSSIIKTVNASRSTMGWRDLPYQSPELIDDILATARDIQENYDAFVVLGIGGSALGPIAVFNALCHPRYNELSNRSTPRFYVEDNVDPERLLSLFDIIDPKTTMFNVITKSGSTSETMSQLLIIADYLKKYLGEDFSKNIIATTDKEKGNLVKIAKQYNIKTYVVPDGVGGRFSELCPVGLLPAAVCGIDIKAMLKGAADMDKVSQNEDYTQNQPYMLALLQVEAMRKGCNIHVVMPYADRLRYFSDWYAQLWAESLGKKTDRNGNIVNVGQTPVKSIGVTDQHSQVQLYTEGPYDKVITFLAVEKYNCELVIPHFFDDIPDVAFLSGHTQNELIQAEQIATEYAVTKSGHLNNSIILSEVNAYTIGQLIYLFEMQTAFAGELLNIDAFDQPGVEEGKNATYALLGKAGYDEKRKELEGSTAKNSKYII